MAGEWAARLYVSEGLAAGAEIVLDPAQYHRLRNVLRLSAGAAVAVFDGATGEYLCRVVALDRREGRLTVERRLRAAEPEPDLWLLFAPIKRARLDWLIEKATELGTGVIQPVWTARTQIERLNLERLRALAVAASEQCGRLTLPALRPPERLDRLLAAWPADRRLLVGDETGGGVPAAKAMAAPSLERAALLIGPEGGFTETELDALGKLTFVTRIGLGPRVLRAETAALAALAAYQAVAGDWLRASPRCGRATPAGEG